LFERCGLAEVRVGGHRAGSGVRRGHGGRARAWRSPRGQRRRQQRGSAARARAHRGAGRRSAGVVCAGTAALLPGKAL